MELPPVYRKVLDIIEESKTDRRTTVEEEIVRRFRLSKEDCRPILRDLEDKGFIERGKYTLKQI